MVPRAVAVLLAATCGLVGGCTSSTPAASTRKALAPTSMVAGTVAPPSVAAPPTTTTDPPPPCPVYPSATYGIDPGSVEQTGGGSQLVTVVDPTSQSVAGILVAWTKGTDGCWSPVSFPGQPAQPYRAETGYGGMRPFAQRQPFDGSTPTGLFSFGTVVYGNSTVSPTTLSPYHHLVCGDWWDEHPGSPTYDTFQHVTCGTTPGYGDVSEALWTETQPYQHFVDIPMPNPPDHVAGIFLHDDTTAGDTAGCIALPNAELDAVLGWLNPADDPHILIAAG